jgi:NTP pyrophosphatase (non-canonical NTP hydrolase)
MTFDNYQKQAMTTALPIGDGGINDLVYRSLGLTNEAGEVAGKVKKLLRDKDGQLSDEDKEAIAQELGDVLWYLQAVASYLGVPLSEIADKNIAKLFSRQNRGTLKGSGDQR